MEASKDKNFNTNLIFASILLLFFLFLILFGPEELPAYKHNLVSIISSLLVGIFGFFLSGRISLKLDSKLFNDKIGKFIINATGGVALFILTLLWWNSSNPPISKLENKIDKIGQDFNRGKVEIVNTVDSTKKELGQNIKQNTDTVKISLVKATSHIDSSITNDGENTRKTVKDVAIAQLETMFPIAVRRDMDVDGTIMHIDGRHEIPIISYEKNYKPLELRWGDRFHYYAYNENSTSREIDSLGTLYLKLSNGITLPLKLGYGEDEVRIPGNKPDPIFATIINPNRISDLGFKITIYSADRERGREMFKEALMKTSLSSRARDLYREINENGVWLRFTPSTNDNNRIRLLRDGTYVKVLETKRGFCKVRLPEGREGWVKSNYISKIL